MSQPLVHVVILNWNLKDDTAECVASVLDSDYSNYHVLVVDNASSDGSPEHLRQALPGLELMVNPANLGFAAGNNVGIRHALDGGADYVLLLNNDATIAATAIRELVACAEGEETIGIVGPKILYYAHRDRIWHLGGRVHRWLPVPVTLGHNQRDDGRFSVPFAVDYVAFCAALIKRSVLETIGLLDEQFFFTYEDSDFCRRAADAGYRILCQPAACVWHKVSVSAQKDTVNVRYLKSKSRAMFYRLHAHGPHPWLTTAYLWASTLGWSLSSLLRGKVAPAKAALRGLYDGYHTDLGEP